MTEGMTGAAAVIATTTGDMADVIGVALAVDPTIAIEAETGPAIETGPATDHAIGETGTKRLY